MRDSDWEADDEDWDDDDAESLQVDCPYCGEQMYEDSPRCPACGKYRSEEDAPPQKKPAWIMITAVILLVLMLAWAAS